MGYIGRHRMVERRDGRRSVHPSVHTPASHFSGIFGKQGCRESNFLAHLTLSTFLPQYVADIPIKWDTAVEHCTGPPPPSISGQYEVERNIGKGRGEGRDWRDTSMDRPD